MAWQLLFGAAALMQPPKPELPLRRAPSTATHSPPVPGPVLPVTQVVSSSSVEVIDGRLVVVRRLLPSR